VSPVIRESNGAVSFEVKVVPRAGKSEIVGPEGDGIKIRLQAPPVEGKANAALVKFLAETFAVPRSQVEILTGHTGRKKVVRIRGVTAIQVEEVVSRR
jgi:uncharacterized protein (TIGR00251 family)